MAAEIYNQSRLGLLRCFDARENNAGRLVAILLDSLDKLPQTTQLNDSKIILGIDGLKAIVRIQTRKVLN
jgi:hypothetical protein